MSLAGVKHHLSAFVEHAQECPRTKATLGVLAASAIGIVALKWIRRRRLDKQVVVSLLDSDPPKYQLLGKDDIALDQASAVVSELRQSFMTGRTRPHAARVKELKALLTMLEENEDDLVDALKEDLGRPKLEAVVYDLTVTAAEVRSLISNLRSYMRPEKVGSCVTTFPSKNYIYKEPLGVVLVIGTWNFPIMLTMIPIAGAIAAGNTVLLKPSNVAPTVSRLIGRLIPQYLSRDVVKVVGHTHKGDRTMIGALLEQKFDHIFFTGNPSVGRVVMTAAAKHLTPCTLELGGKNPVFVAPDADIDVAAKRTMLGRMMNTGQACVAPDYVLVHKDVASKFYERCRHWIKVFYEGHPEEPGRTGRIVNDRRMAALQHILDTHGGNVVCGGETDASSRFVAPTVLRVDIDSPVMEEETFGPILMVVEVDDMKTAVRYVASRPKPLSLYLYTNSKETQDMIVQNTSSGGVTVNGTLFHAAHPGLPFGGVGESGMGAYHGKATFDTFTHRKPVLKKAIWHDFGLLSDPFFLYPPWTSDKLAIFRRLL